MYSEMGPKEGTAHHTASEKKMGFSYRNLLGELMYVYMTYRCDIGYAVTTLSKFSTSTSEFHYKLLKTVAKYLKSTSSWGIQFKRLEPMKIDENDFHDKKGKGGFYRSEAYSIPDDPSLTSVFDIDVDKPILHCFVNATNANDLRK